ncbi:MAG: hydroxymethylbilane synthase [Calditrichaeota bacterium]|nr:MAG: hydroxymethylbilane synthase [Calditrichota bacterium]
MSADIIHIGSRGSQLALWQTEWVKERLAAAHPTVRFEVTVIKTTGDRILDRPLNKIGDKGLFTKEIDNALLRGDIDLAVHSLKDLPTTLPEGLTIAAITERWDVRDALISRAGATLKALPRGAVVATGSLRRKAQLLHHRPDLRIVDLRGNLNTRFRKFQESDWEGMILATAGVERLGWQDRIAERISTDIILPAVGQGSFAVVCREGDEQIQALVQPVHHRPSALAGYAERALLRTLEGGCHVPIGAHARVEGGQFVGTACIGSLDGRRLVRESLSREFTPEFDRSAAEGLGVELARRLLDAGGEEILAEIRQVEER